MLKRIEAWSSLRDSAMQQPSAPVRRTAAGDSTPPAGSRRQWMPRAAPLSSRWLTTPISPLARRTRQPGG
jgi:hypothetical protein